MNNEEILRKRFFDAILRSEGVMERISEISIMQEGRKKASRKLYAAMMVSGAMSVIHTCEKDQVSDEDAFKKMFHFFCPEKSKQSILNINEKYGYDTQSPAPIMALVEMFLMTYDIDSILDCGERYDIIRHCATMAVTGCRLLWEHYTKQPFAEMELLLMILVNPITAVNMN